MNERIQQWLDLMTRKYDEQQFAYVRSMNSSIVPGRVYLLQVEGRKYIKIVAYYIEIKLVYGVNPEVGSKSVHAFVDKATGDVFKPASWASPAKIARFNILNDESFNRMIQNCDIHGSYLYLRG